MRRLLFVLALLLSTSLASAQIIRPGQSAALNAQDAFAGVNLGNDGVVVVQVQGSFTGTLTFEGSIGGSVYSAISLLPVGGTTAASTTTTTGIWSGPVSGLPLVRVRFSSYGGGAAVISFQTFYAASSGGGGGGGGTQYTNNLAVATPTGTVALGYDGSNVRAVTTAANGHLQTDCSNCSGSGASNTDNSAFVQSTNSEAPAAGLYTTSWTNPTSGRSTIFRSTINGAMYGNIDTVGASSITLGQKAMANAFPIVIASDQSAVPASQSGNWSVRAQDGGGNALTSATRGAQQALSVQIVDGSGNQITSFGGAGGTSQQDNTAFTQSTTLETPIGCFAATNDAAYTTATTGRSTIPQCTTKGHAIVDVGNGSAVDGSNRAVVVGAGTAGSATGGVLTVQGVSSMTPVQVSQATAGNLNATVVGTGTFTTQSSLTAGTAYVGKVATWADGTLKSGAVTSAMTGTTSTSVIPGTGSNYTYITQCTASNASTTVSTDILLQDGSGGTTLYVIPAPAAAVATTGGGGASISFPVPLKVPTIGNGLFAANVTTGSSTKISCSGFTSTTSF